MRVILCKEGKKHKKMQKEGRKRREKKRLKREENRNENMEDRREEREVHVCLLQTGGIEAFLPQLGSCVHFFAVLFFAVVE